MKSEKFSFTHGKLTLRGYLDSPDGVLPKGIVIIVHGDGRSNIDAGGFSRLRNGIVAAKYSCCIWDKPGCGRSDGRYKQEVVNYTADEVLSGISELIRIGAPGCSNIGLWGESRAGWICPLVIRDFPAVAFWIIVGGTDSKESMGYMIQSHLELAGRPRDVSESLTRDWVVGTRLFLTGGSVFDYLRTTSKLRKDPFYRRYIGPHSTVQILVGYKFMQHRYMKSPRIFDELSGLEIYVQHFESILENIKCPVLAIFGERDRMVD